MCASNCCAVNPDAPPNGVVVRAGGGGGGQGANTCSGRVCGRVFVWCVCVCARARVARVVCVHALALIQQGFRVSDLGFGD